MPWVWAEGQAFKWAGRSARASGSALSGLAVSGKPRQSLPHANTYLALAKRRKIATSESSTPNLVPDTRYGFQGRWHWGERRKKKSLEQEGIHGVRIRRPGAHNVGSVRKDVKPKGGEGGRRSAI